MYKYKAIKVNGKKIDEHRHIMQVKLGRKLSFNEIVHHKNGDPLDNSDNNLELVNRSQHARHHWLRGDLNLNPFLAGHNGGKQTRLRFGKKIMICSLDGTELMSVTGAAYAARITKIGATTVNNILTGRRKPYKYLFKSI